MSQTFHCPNCGAPLDPPAGSELSMRCPFCSSSVIIPDELRRESPGPDTLSRAQAMAEMPESARDMMEIIQMVKAGKKEEAISHFRLAFDTSRAEAVATIEAIEQNQVVQLSHAQTFTVPHVSTSPATTFLPVSSAKTVAPRVAGGACLGLFIAAVTLGILSIVAMLAMTQKGGPLYGWWQKTNPFSKSPLILSFGEEGTMPGQLFDPQSIAVDNAGNIYVADLTTGRIQQFDPQGTFVRLWDVGDGKVIIWDLEVDQNGILFAAVERNIMRYDTKTGEELGSLPNPNNYWFYDIKILSDGSIGAVVDNETLVRMNSDGSLVWIVEDAISSIADESDSNCRLGVDGNNNFYLGGNTVESIFKYSPEGKYLNRWGSDGDEPGQFDSIHAVAMDNQGRVVVSDLDTLEIFDTDGRFIEQIELPDAAFDLQYDLQGNLYTVTINPPRVDVHSFK